MSFRFSAFFAAEEEFPVFHFFAGEQTFMVFFFERASSFFSSAAGVVV